MLTNQSRYATTSQSVLFCSEWTGLPLLEARVLRYLAESSRLKNPYRPTTCSAMLWHLGSAQMPPADYDALTTQDPRCLCHTLTFSIGIFSTEALQCFRVLEVAQVIFRVLEKIAQVITFPLGLICHKDWWFVHFVMTSCSSIILSSTQPLTSHLWNSLSYACILHQKRF